MKVGLLGSITILHCMWAMKESAIIFGNCVWLRAPQAPISIDRIVGRITKIMLMNS